MDVFFATVIFNSFVSMLAIERFMGIFFKQRRTSIVIMAVTYLLTNALGFFVLTFVAIPMLNLVNSFLVLFVITLLYQSSWKKRIVAILCIALFMMTIELLVVVVIINPTNIDMLVAGGGVYNEDRSSLRFVIGPLLTYFIATILRKFKNLKRVSVAAPVFWASSITISALSVIIILLSMLYLPQIAALVTFGAIFVINLLTLYLCDSLSTAYEEKLKSALHAQEKDYYFSQCQLMQESVEQVKSIRHDMKLHLSAVKGYTADNKAATDYINSLLGDINESEIYSDTGNIAFDSIINFKLNKAKEENIKPDIRLLIPPTINIEVADIAAILGNLLDNALDALAKVEDKMLKLDIEFSKESLFIKVDNAFDGVVNYAKRKDGETKHIVTRKAGGEHGHGLINIKRSIENYNGHMDITHEDNVFSVAVILYVDNI